MRALLLLSALLLIPMTSWAGAPNKAIVLLKEMDSDRLDQVVAAGEQLMAMPPKSMATKLRVKAGLQLAEAYEKTADFGRAAKLYAAHANESPRNGDAQSSRLNAARLFAREGDFDSAIGAFEQYLSHAKSSAEDRSEAMLSMISLEEERQDWPGLVKRVDGYLSMFPKASAETRLGVLLLKQRALQRLDRQFDAARNTGDILAVRLTDEEAKTSTVRQAQAEARFLTLEPEYRAYAGFKFLSDRTLGTDLNNLLSRKKTLEANYLKVIEVGDNDMTIASLVRVASLSQAIADAIRAAPRPKGLDDIDCCVCFMNDPAEDELDRTTAGRYNFALSKAFESGVYNEWTLEAVSALERLQPDRFPEPVELPLRLAEARLPTP